MLLMVDKYEFSEWLQAQMGERQISQSELARRSGLHRAIISKIINQISVPTPETVEALANGLKLPPELVYRAAGLLPPIPEERSQIDELRYLANLLSDEELQEVIDYARHRLDRQQGKAVPKNKTSRSNSPARNR